MMADGCCFENSVLNCMADFDEIWQADEHQVPSADWPLKFRICENPRWWRQPS